MCILSNMNRALSSAPGAGRVAICLAASATFFLLCGCGRLLSKPAPKITFTVVPPAYDGDLDVMRALSGKVSGAKPGQHIVLYAKSEGRWWIQPAVPSMDDSAAPSEWHGQSHSGMEYEALLVEDGFTPPQSSESSPEVGNQILAVATVPGTGSHPAPSQPQTLHFSGYDWTVRSEPSHRAGSRNEFNPANAWVDPKGALHLRITRNGDRWTCAEVKLNHSLGYGTYSWGSRGESTRSVLRSKSLGRPER